MIIFLLLFGSKFLWDCKQSSRLQILQASMQHLNNSLKNCRCPSACSDPKSESTFHQNSKSIFRMTLTCFWLKSCECLRSKPGRLLTQWPAPLPILALDSDDNSSKCFSMDIEGRGIQMKAHPYLISRISEGEGKRLEHLDPRERRFDEKWLQGLLAKHPDLFPTGKSNLSLKTCCWLGERSRSTPAGIAQTSCISVRAGIR